MLVKFLVVILALSLVELSIEAPLLPGNAGVYRIVVGSVTAKAH